MKAPKSYSEINYSFKENHSRTGHTRICSKHFVNGVKSHSRNHVDYIPTLYLPDENGKVVNSEPVEDASNDFSDAEEVDGPVTPFNEDLNDFPVHYLNIVIMEACARRLML